VETGTGTAMTVPIVGANSVSVGQGSVTESVVSPVTVEPGIGTPVILPGAGAVMWVPVGLERTKVLVE
jgi:hypothetical protein